MLFLVGLSISFSKVLDSMSQFIGLRSVCVSFKINWLFCAYCEDIFDCLTFIYSLSSSFCYGNFKELFIFDTEIDTFDWPYYFLAVE
jgi:hypothetical protein